MENNENTRPGASRLRQPTTKNPLSPNRSLVEMSASDTNTRSQIPSMGPPKFQGGKHRPFGLPEPQAKRETLADRAGRPAHQNSAAPPSSRPVSDNVRSTIQTGYRNGLPGPAHSRSLSSASSRIASGSSLASSVGPGTRPPSSFRPARSHSQISHARSNTHGPNTNSRPPSSNGHHSFVQSTSSIGTSKGNYPISLSFNQPGLRYNQRVVSDNREYTYYIDPRKDVVQKRPFNNRETSPPPSCISRQSSFCSLNSKFDDLRIGNIPQERIEEETFLGSESQYGPTPSKIPRLNSSLSNSVNRFPLSPSPKKAISLRKSRSMSPMKSVYLTKDSNAPVPVFEPDLESMLDEKWSKQFETLKKEMAVTMSKEDDKNEVMKLLRARISELEEVRTQLSTMNSRLQDELELSKRQLWDVNRDLEDQKRSQKFELEDLRRQTEREISDLNERLQRELKREKEETEKAAEKVAKDFQEQIGEMEKAHKELLQEQDRQIKSQMEEERNQKSRELQELTAQSTLRLQESSQDLEKRIREADDIRRERDEALTALEREKALRASLEDKLADAAASTITLETSNRAMKAKIDFLESDNQAQGNAFADLHRLKQEAEEAMNVALEKLRTEETLRRKLHNQVQELKGNIRVMCRVRPASEEEAKDAAKIAFPDADLDSKEVVVQGPEKANALGAINSISNSFSFDRVFDTTSHNAGIFEEISQLVQSALDGYNVCIFCYGQTGSGKTFTMSSADGMIPRATQQIYSEAQRLGEKGWAYKMEGSFVEVYNENLNDLLGKAEELDKKKLEIRHDLQKKTTTITDVTTVELDSPTRVEEILQRASANRSVAATKANNRSSRSHSVFILKLIGENSVTGERSEGTLNLVDLAGSERLAHSGATGDRLKETQSINKSLSCLGDVIGALGQGKEGTHIPYRNSKLTYLLQNSLGGNSKTLMFVMISPLQAHLSETLTSLKFATKVHNTHIGTAKKQSRVKD